MNTSKSDHNNGCPLPLPCGWCGGQLTKGYCVPCSIRLLYDLSQWLDRIEEERRKQLWLSKLRFALAGASWYLPGFDTAPIQQAIKEAHPLRAVKAYDIEEEAATETS